MKRPGFTLVELLVVIAVIAILIALSIAALHASRQRAKTTLCASRIKQMALDLLMYDTDNGTFPHGFVDSFSPPPGGYPGFASRDHLGWWWFNFLQGYNDTKKPLLCCPSKSQGHPSLKKSVLNGNYGVNRSVFKTSGGTLLQKKDGLAGTPLSSGDVTGATLLILDNGYSVTSWWHAVDVPPLPLVSGKAEDTGYVPGLEINKGRNLLPGQEQDAIDGRHPNKTVNVGFGDSHVSTLKARNLFVEKATDGYVNRSPLWSPK
jgi:prepilin-type N-terminal cleavage/methylation domain-containing protein/prepilin-type processing-associated H-X9-DG protein